MEGRVFKTVAKKQILRQVQSAVDLSSFKVILRGIQSWVWCKTKFPCSCEENRNIYKVLKITVGSKILSEFPSHKLKVLNFYLRWVRKFVLRPVSVQVAFMFISPFKFFNLLVLWNRYYLVLQMENSGH